MKLTYYKCDRCGVDDLNDRVDFSQRTWKARNYDLCLDCRATFDRMKRESGIAISEYLKYQTCADSEHESAREGGER